MMNTKAENERRFKSLSGKRVASLKFTEDVLGWTINHQEKATPEDFRKEVQRAAHENFGHGVDRSIVDMLEITLVVAGGGFGETFVFTLAAAVMQLMRE